MNDFACVPFCASVCTVPQRPEDDIRSPKIRLTDGCESVLLPGTSPRSGQVEVLICQCLLSPLEPHPLF